MDVLSTTLIAIAAHPENVLSLIVAHTLVTTSDSSAATPIDTEDAEIATDRSESQPTNAQSSIDRAPATAGGRANARGRKPSAHR
jgi:hypothetical protein